LAGDRKVDVHRCVAGLTANGGCGQASAGLDTPAFAI
jgi:hypothetical protein